jgi:acyl-CoA dehydrogenase
MEAAAFKMFASEMCGRVADRCVQIHGGAGYLAEYEAERFFRDARIYRIYEGTTQIMQLVIAKQMLKDFAGGGRLILTLPACCRPPSGAPSATN